MPVNLKEPERPLRVKIADWPRWLTYEHLFWLPLILQCILSLYFEFLWRDYRGMALTTVITLAIAFVILAIRYLRSERITLRKVRRHKTQKFCDTCGYDLRGTPLRCPECGHQTRLKRWLDVHPLDRAIYEGLLNRPQARTIVRDEIGATRSDCNPS